MRVRVLVRTTSYIYNFVLLNFRTSAAFYFCCFVLLQLHISTASYLYTITLVQLLGSGMCSLADEGLLERAKVGEEGRDAPT